MAQINYTNKVALNENPEILDINKVTDDDMNEIKQVVNDNYNNTIQITDTEPTDSDNKIWIDTGEVQNIGSEIESGSNENGNYIKFADGTMICTKKVQVNGIAVNTAEGSNYKSGNISLGNFAQTFTATPVINRQINGSYSGWISNVLNPSSSSAGEIVVTKSISSNASNYSIHIIAIGRWKA